MKIENNNVNPSAFNKTEGPHQLDRQHAAAAENASAVSKKDRAELSDQARLLSKARTALENIPEVDQAKVDNLKAKIQNGGYNIPFADLAEKMLSKLGLK